jgi:hypothetical protein
MKYTRPVQKVSSHTEYLKKWSCVIHVTWQPVRGDLAAHLRTVTLTWGSRQRDAVNWACALCDHHISQWPSKHNSFIMTTRLLILQLSCTLFWWSVTSPRSVSPHTAQIWIPVTSVFFPKAKIAIEREEIHECDGHMVNKLSRWHLTADWLAPRDSDCSWMHSKVSSDWLPSYIKATWLVLETFKMAGYIPYRSHVIMYLVTNTFIKSNLGDIRRRWAVSTQLHLLLNSSLQICYLGWMKKIISCKSITNGTLHLQHIFSAKLPTFYICEIQYYQTKKVKG